MKVLYITLMIGGAILAACLLGALMASMDHTRSENKRNGPLTEWQPLGSVSDGEGHCALYKTLDESNGATIYITVGYNKTGLFVLPAPEKKKP